MSDDQWNNNNNKPGNDWNTDLPEPGESWDSKHEPKPIYKDDDNWGTAPFDGTVNPQQPQGQQQSQGQPPYQQQPQQQQGYTPSGYQQPQGQPPYSSNPNPQHNIVYQPNAMTTSNQLDNNDIVAIVLSIFFPGAGHIVLGQTGKGIAIIAGMILTCGMFAILWPIVIIDAVMVAQASKKRPVGDWEFFPR